MLNFVLFFVNKVYNKVFPCFYETFTNSENPTSNPLQGELVPAYLEPPVTLKVVPKAACDLENCSESQP